MNYKKYLLIILTICFGTSVSFANQQAKADSVAVNTTDSISVPPTTPVSTTATDSVADKKKVSKKTEKKEKKADKKAGKKSDKKTASKTPKKNKKTETVEYKARRQAAIVAMDSIIRAESAKRTMLPEYLMAFADKICEDYNNDPILMDSIADKFFLHYDERTGNERFMAIKKLYPATEDIYYSEARLFHSLAWIEGNGKCNPEHLEKAYQQIDSAKLVVPDSEEPYMLWIRLQSPYKHVKTSANVASIDEELEQVKKKFPNYPCYLETARYYEEILSKKDKTMYLDAAEYYEKAGNYGEMTAAHWNNLALLAFQFYGSFKTSDYGVIIAKRGLEQFPNYPGLIRLKLWNEGRDKQWEEVISTSKLLFQYGDSLEPSYNDYKYLAQAYQNTKQYTEAIQFFKKELELVKDTTERMTAMIDLVKCYNQKSFYDEAINTFAHYESLKNSKGEQMDYIDYQNIINSYLYAAGDTTINISNEKKIEYINKADSILAIAGERSPKYINLINSRRLSQCANLKNMIEHGDLKNKRFAFSEILEAAQRLVQSETDVIEKKDLDYYRLMEGYYFLMLHYWMGEDDLNAYLISEQMLSVDMPSDMELVTLSKTQKGAYTSYLDLALQVNTMYGPKYGKKKRR